MKQIKQDRKGSKIDTVAGQCEYLLTEIEDQNGRWADHYSTTAGYYVIHSGSDHHIYKLL